MSLFLPLPNRSNPLGAGQHATMKIYISSDMEGLAGAVTDQQLGPEGFEYERFREFMTAEVNAAIKGAMQAGATEFVISDSHGNGENLLIERLPKDVLIVRSWPRPLEMMEGIDESFAGAFFLGFHTSTSNPDGVRAHTMSSATLAEVRLGGVAVGEGALNAAIAGHFGVPILMVSGDAAVAAELQGVLGDVEAAVVKWPISFHSAKTLTPQAAQELITRTAKAAVGRIADFKPYRMEAPIELEVRFKNYRPAQLLSYLPIVEQTDSHSVRFIGKDMLEISRFLSFLLGYNPALSP